MMTTFKDKVHYVKVEIIGSSRDGSIRQGGSVALAPVFTNESLNMATQVA